MPERAPGRVYGWREVLLVGAAIVAIVLGISLITTILPDSARWLVFQSPIAIVVIAGGTILVLASLLRRPRAE